MTLKTQLALDMSTFFNTDEFAEEVTYDGSAINAVVTAWTENKESDTPTVSIPDLAIIIQVADVATPATGKAVVVGGVNYRVSQVVQGDNSHTWLLGLSQRF